MDANVIKRIVYFAQLEDEQLQEIASQSHELTLERGQVLFSEGDECRGLHFVITGSVKVSRISPEGREQVLSIMGPFQTFGDVPVFDRGKNPATVTAMETSTIGMIPNDVIHTLIEENNVSVRTMLRVFASRLRLMTTLVADLTHLDVTGRIAKVLLAYHNSTDSFTFQLSQQDLASMVGTTREVASRSLRSLEEQKCIVRMGGVIKIVSLDCLKIAIESSGK